MSSSKWTNFFSSIDGTVKSGVEPNKVEFCINPDNPEEASGRAYYNAIIQLDIASDTINDSTLTMSVTSTSSGVITVSGNNVKDKALLAMWRYLDATDPHFNHSFTSSLTMLDNVLLIDPSDVTSQEWRLATLDKAMNNGYWNKSQAEFLDALVPSLLASTSTKNLISKIKSVETSLQQSSLLSDKDKVEIFRLLARTKYAVHLNTYGTESYISVDFSKGHIRRLFCKYLHSTDRDYECVRPILVGMIGGAMGGPVTGVLGGLGGIWVADDLNCFD